MQQGRTMDDSKAIAEAKTKPRTGLIEFARETRREISKVTWPTRQETVLTTVYIIVMALIVGMFFFMIDSGLGYAVGSILGMKS